MNKFEPIEQYAGAADQGEGASAKRRKPVWMGRCR